MLSTIHPRWFDGYEFIKRSNSSALALLSESFIYKSPTFQYKRHPSIPSIYGFGRLFSPIHAFTRRKIVFHVHAEGKFYSQFIKQ